MAKVSPILRSFNAGEFSSLMDGRSDLDRYPASMRKLFNYIAVPQGPAIGRPGTFMVTPVYDEEKRSAIVPFVFSELQAFLLEFADEKMRVILASGPQLSGGVPYEIDTPYSDADVAGLRVVQSGDVVYLLHESYRTRKLSRYGATDWRLTEHAMIDGPFLPTNTTSTRLSPSGTGNVGMTASVSGLAAQQVTIEYTPAAPVAISGYYLQSTGSNSDPDYSAKDSAPADWQVDGWDGTVWTTLDQKSDHVLYDNKRTPFFPLSVPVAYVKYRVVVFAVQRNGPVQPAFTAFFAAAGASITLTASSAVGINRDQGFLPTDVGRLIRYKSMSDGSWASLVILSRVSATQVTARPQQSPLADANGTGEWRLGYWSDTTGWPNCGTLFEDRLWLGGSKEYPDVVVGSTTGAYENLAQTSEAGVVSDDNAVVFQLNSRKISRIAWMQSDERGLLIGTGSGEWAVTSGERDGVITARSIKARNSTARGSAGVEPVKVDRQIVYVQRSQRTVREFTYVYEADGYKSPSMSLFASHVGVPRFVEMDYAAEPHSIVWFRMGNGRVAGLTYNRDENVVGWHQHDFSGGFVESLAVIPSASGDHDALWLVVRREIGGVTRRFIERMTRFWDFDMTVDDIHLVDCAARYDGPPTSSVYVPHLKGAQVYGLADGAVVGAVVDDAGMFNFDVEASTVLVGLPYDAVGVTNRLEAGAADGTAQGKIKRIHKAVVRVWRSIGGLVGRSETELEPLLSRQLGDENAVPLRDEDHIVEWPNGYDRDAVIAFKRPGHSPLPLNIIAVMPQMVTQDGG